MSTYDRDVFWRDFLTPLLNRIESVTGKVVALGEPLDVNLLSEGSSPGAGRVDALLGYEAGLWLTHRLAGEVFGPGDGTGGRLLATFREVVGASLISGIRVGTESPIDGARTISVARDFLLACGAAMEDAASSARRECLRLLYLSPDSEFEDRIGSVNGLTQAILAQSGSQNGRPLAVESSLEEVDWVLDGRECAVDDWDSPANWRTSAALRGASRRFPIFDGASTQLATAAIRSLFGPPDDTVTASS